MRSEIIRQKFAAFFEGKQHRLLPAASLSNAQDPSLMFTNAGMNQFKDVLLGQSKRPCRRVITFQPCLRVAGKHNDLEEVGTDTYHHTCFEMLGSWSFGDYFKQEAIFWAWELLTQVYELPPDRLYATVFEGDAAAGLTPDEDSERLWEACIDKSHIVRLDRSHNFWEMGATGPCGPCTEIHIDLRSANERTQTPGARLVGAGHPEVIELWNLVFMEYARSADGTLTALSEKHVDTGMGLERLAMVLQGKTSTYDTDLFVPLLQALGRLSGFEYGTCPQRDKAMRVVADHIRAIALAMADGVKPDRNGPGYVLRRLLRRAVRYGYVYLGLRKPFMYTLVEPLTREFEEIYPHLHKEAMHVAQGIEQEETSFLRTLAAGLTRLDHMLEALQTPCLSGESAFELYDTYGFPIDLTALVSQERGIAVDQDGFLRALQAQRDRSKRAAYVAQDDWHTVPENADRPGGGFVGYDRLEATVYVQQHRSVVWKDAPAHQLIFNQTPFYAESGGQVGDTGTLSDSEETIEVLDTQYENKARVHYVRALPIDLRRPLIASVNRARRNRIASHHSATHLLHAALRHIVGPHVEQRGSWVGEDMLRFDFSHDQKLDVSTLHRLETWINEKVRANTAVEEKRCVPLEEAKRMGATALFSEKYGQNVRVVILDPAASIELCGGTHVARTGEIGYCKITQSLAVAAGTRRIEMQVGEAAEGFVAQQLTDLHQAKTLLKNPKSLQDGLKKIFKERIDLTQMVDRYESAYVHLVAEKLKLCVNNVHGVSMLIEALPEPVVRNAVLPKLVSALSMQAPYFVVLTALVEDAVHLLVQLSPCLATAWGQRAPDVLRRLTPHIEGVGGGRAHWAVGSGKRVSGVLHVLDAARRLATENAPC